MADIFLSYAREDAEKADLLGSALTDLGWSVFWDRSIAAGSWWDEVIESELKASKCVVVLWSAISSKSKWVKTEANYGLQAGTLVPASLDGTDPPLAFQLMESAQLLNWTGDHGDPEFLVLTRGISRYAAPGGHVATSHDSDVRVAKRVSVPRVLTAHSPRWLAAVGTATVVAVLALASWGIYGAYYSGAPPSPTPSPENGNVSTKGDKPTTDPSATPGGEATRLPDAKLPEPPDPKLPDPKKPDPPDLTGSGRVNRSNPKKDTGGAPANIVKPVDREKQLAADRHEIENVLFTYRDSYNARNLETMRTVFKKASERIFPSERSCSKALLTFGAPPQIEIRGDRQANVTVAAIYTCYKTTKQKNREISKASDVFDMVKEDGGWTIAGRLSPIQAR